MSGYNLPGLGPVLRELAILVALALFGLRMASWEPSTPVDTVLVTLAAVVLVFVALWCVLVVAMLVRYDLTRWVRGRR